MKVKTEGTDSTLYPTMRNTLRIGSTSFAEVIRKLQNTLGMPI